ncbi:MAG: MgtC/SapB family protein [Planctomycetaceae bacterium]|nr:MgtC/SapB family protein [Planctomycetaceae bacterium]
MAHRAFHAVDHAAFVFPECGFYWTLHFSLELGSTLKIVTAHDYLAIAVSLGLGLLVGLQREWKNSAVAGIRTFPVITLTGTLTALVGNGSSEWVIAAGLLAVAALMVTANVAKLQQDEEDLGMTTEAAALLMFAVGAALGSGLTGPPIMTAGIAAVLLHWKQPLHGLVDRIGERDLKGLIQLTLIALVILPVLPDQTYDPYDVLNPYRIWLMVVLIVGISMVAYVAYRILGARVGAILGGVLGGFISSTATTVSYARQSKDNPDTSAVAALVILIASTIVNVRVLIEIGAVSPQLLKAAILPFSVLLLLMTVECIVLYIPLRKKEPKPPKHDNPAQLKPAIIFGTLYAVILIIVAAAKKHFGDQALYGVAMISGLTDVDAITLSTAKLFKDGLIEAETAWRITLIATMSNLVFKTGAVAFLGNRQLLLYVAVLFGVAFLGSGAVLLFWPDIAITLPVDWQKTGTGQ